MSRGERNESKWRWVTKVYEHDIRYNVDDIFHEDPTPTLPVASSVASWARGMCDVKMCASRSGVSSGLPLR